ncbi:Uncharacterised protein [Vibrio cholerae]|nr:Uncharacterised protein [Vibrio cholerae]
MLQQCFFITGFTDIDFNLLITLWFCGKWA